MVGTCLRFVSETPVLSPDTDVFFNVRSPTVFGSSDWTNPEFFVELGMARPELYIKWKAKGRCTYCGRRPGLPGYKLCNQCRESLAAKRATQKKAWRGEGLCPDCGQQPEPGRKTCPRCLAKARKRNRARYHRQTRFENLETKARLFEAMGGVQCPRCPEARIECLTLDHVAQDGAKRRRNGEQAGTVLYHRLLERPEEQVRFRVLCYNCNIFEYRQHCRSQ